MFVGAKAVSPLQNMVWTRVYTNLNRERALLLPHDRVYAEYADQEQ